MKEIDKPEGHNDLKIFPVRLDVFNIKEDEETLGRVFIFYNSMKINYMKWIVCLK